MFDLIEMLLDVLVNGLELVGLWRFMVCFLPAVVAAIVIYLHVSNRPLGIGLSMLVALAGVVLGAVWEVNGG